MAAATKARAANGSKQASAFPAEYRKLSPNRRLEWLGGAVCAALVRNGRLQSNQVQKEATRIERSRVAVYQIAPSSVNVADFMNGQPFPPRAEHTPMVTADRVLCRSEIPVLWPASYLRGGETYDVVVYKDLVRRAHIEGLRDLNHGTTESPTRIAVDAMERKNEAIRQRRLVTSDTYALQHQIAAFKATGSTKILAED